MVKWHSIKPSKDVLCLNFFEKMMGGGNTHGTVFNLPYRVRSFLFFCAPVLVSTKRNKKLQHCVFLFYCGLSIFSILQS